MTTPNAESNTTPPESRITELEGKLNELVSTLAHTREALDTAERRHQIDLLLIEDGAVDLETARMLTEAAAERSTDKDIKAAVAEVRKRKPFLFRSAPSVRTGGAMGAAPPSTPDPLRTQAAEAAETGDRTALLRYLSARRQGA